MELRCMQSPPGSGSSIPPSVLLEKPFLCGHTIVKFHGFRRTCPDARRLKSVDFTARASGPTKIKSQAQAQDAISSNSSSKEKDLVFVAGATGKVGSRTVRELLKLGFKVRAGVRSIQRAGSLVQSVKNMKLEGVAGGTQPTDEFELVECDLEKPNQIGPALANSSTVICCIGASEKEIFDVTGPYRIDYMATKNLIDAATTAKVDHFILVTSLGTNKFGFPAAILNLFWGVLCWKRKAEEALVASGLSYTIVRPGGMERPTDSFKETHNITLSEEDTLFGGLVSNLQVAELIAVMAKNPSLSCCKVVEVVAETTAPLTPMEDLLKKIPAKRVCSFPEPDVVDASQAVTPDSEEPEEIKATKDATPLSPYTAYEDLKPPSSPSPTPSTGSGPTEATTSTSESVKVDSLVTATISTDTVIPQTAPKKKSASSPYMNYEDLKPPTSPTPTPSTGSSPTEASKIDIAPSETDLNPADISTISINDVIPQAAPKKPYPLSPYMNYEDLKPPTSPTPTPSGPVKEPPVAPTSMEITPQITEVNDVAKSESTDVEKDSTNTLASTQSPFLAYDDLKPPSSPSPSAPSATGNNSPLDPVDEKAGEIKEHAEPKSTPLSPYTMYEDLKPPSSPMPAPQKL